MNHMLVPAQIMCATSLAAVESHIGVPIKPINDYVKKTDVEAYVFGVSYHTNRKIDWNETNPGLGIGLAYHYDKNVDITCVGGTYKDSYFERATFALVGARIVCGNRDSLHATFGVNGGYFMGSDMHGIGIMPIVSVGYDWIDLCMTGYPGPSTSKNTGSSDPRYNHGAPSGFIGLFLKMRLVTF
jgi:hypothetical protein